MSIAEIKNNLHKLVVETNDEKILKTIQKIFNELNNEEESDWWEELNEKDKKNINRGLKESEEGIFVSDDDVKERIKKLYKSKL